MMITFVAIPTMRNYVQAWQKKHIDGSATRNLLHEEVVKKRVKWREELIEQGKVREGGEEKGGRGEERRREEMREGVFSCHCKMGWTTSQTNCAIR